MKLLLIVFLAGLAAESLAEKTSCKDKKFMDSFDLKQMAGTWYEFKWSESIREQILFWLFGRKCTKQVYTYVEKTEELTFTIIKTKTKSDVISTDISNGIVVYANKNVKSGAVAVSEFKSGKLSDPWPYKILAFNPGKFCIVRTCSLFGFESVTVLAYTQHPSDEDKKRINDAILEVHNKFEAPAPSDYKEFSKEACDDN